MAKHFCIWQSQRDAKLSTVAASAVAIALLTNLPSPVQAIALVTQRTALAANDQINWSSLGPTNPFNFLPLSFSAKSEGGLGLNINIPSPGSNITPPFVFQTFPSPGIPTNFASGDFILFTGLKPGSFPAVGNPGPITITFATPVKGAGAQIAVDDTLQFTGFISAFDDSNNLLGTFEAAGTSSTALDNSALFLGVTNETANISRLVFSSSVQERAIGINTLSLVTNPTAVTEPSLALGLLTLGILGLGKTLKRKSTPNS